MGRSNLILIVMRKVKETKQEDAKGVTEHLELSKERSGRGLPGGGNL